MKRSYTILLMALMTITAMAASAKESTLATLNTPSVQVTSPNGGESFYVNEPVTITWKTYGPATDGTALMLSTDGGKSYRTVLAEMKTPQEVSLRENKVVEHSWIWERHDLVNENLMLKIVLYSGRDRFEDTSDKLFAMKSASAEMIARPNRIEAVRSTLDGPQTVHVLSPNGGEVFYTNEKAVIRWEMTGRPADRIGIKLSTDGGKSYPYELALLIATRDPHVDGDGPPEVDKWEQSWLWDNPGPAGDQLKIKVILYTAMDVVIADESDGVFTIEDRSPSSVIAPVSAFPNPFNPVTTIAFNLNASVPVELKVYDMQGRLVSTLVNNTLPAGSHKATFDGSALSSGTYIYRLNAGDKMVQNTVQLIK